MTSALKAMVEAMAAEIERQARAGGLYAPPDGVMYDERIATVDGSVDLEKVARAALRAIRTPGDEVDAGVSAADQAADPFVGTEDEGIPADPEDARVAWTYIIDEILKAEP